MEFKSEYYNETQIEQFIISYGFKDGKIGNKNISVSNLSFQYYKNNKLLISFNPLDFGKVINITKLDIETLYILQSKDNLIFKILSSEKQNSIEIFKNGDLIIKFIDLKLGENRFVRIIDNSKKYYFENNEQILFTKENKTKFISKLSKTNKLVNNFITIDIETYIKDNILVPFCISIYDGNINSYFYLTNHINPEDLIITALKSIMLRKYNGYNVYLHNMAKFDIIFLFKYLAKLGSLNPIIHNNRIISIDFNYGKNNNYQIKFKDSYLLLLNSLSKLSKSFNVETQKSVFPYLFVNETNLNYVGNTPDIKYFDNKINTSDYNQYISNFDNN
jgi:hypothetical protein